MKVKVDFPKGSHPLDNPWNTRVLQFARERGDHIYIVGGYLRDILLHWQKGAANERSVKDIDYAVQGGSAMEFARTLSDRLSAHFVPLDEANDTARVVSDDGVVLDFAGCVGGNIQTDVMRRDFTINALVWDPEYPDELMDMVGGLDDLKRVSIKAISENSFKEDPLRVMRAFRLSTTLDGSIEENTLGWARAHAGRLTDVAAERINYELFSSLAGAAAGPVVNQLAQAGVLEVIFPELRQTRNVTPNSYHHLGLFDHSIITVSELDARMSELPEWARQAAAVELSAGVSRLAATRLACILHDIGKPKTWIITPEGKHTFVGHDKLGGEMTEAIGERMRWSRPVERFITRLVALHLRPGQLFHQGEPSQKALNRFYRQVGVDVPELMMVAFADLGATRGQGLMGETRERLDRSLTELLSGYKAFMDEVAARALFLNGHDIMKLLSLPPGPVVGELLKALEEARDANEVVSRSEAEAFVRRTHSEKYSK